MMRKKLGLYGEETNDETLITDLLSWMMQNKADYTNTFYSLIKEDALKDILFQKNSFLNWYNRWQERLTQNKRSIEFSLSLMRQANPLIIPRNYKVEEVLEAATINGDLNSMHNLLRVLKKPYDNQLGITSYQLPPAPSEHVYQTICGK